MYPDNIIELVIAGLHCHGFTGVGLLELQAILGPPCCRNLDLSWLTSMLSGNGGCSFFKHCITQKYIAIGPRHAIVCSNSM